MRLDNAKLFYCKNSDAAQVLECKELWRKCSMKEERIKKNS